MVEREATDIGPVNKASETLTPLLYFVSVALQPQLPGGTVAGYSYAQSLTFEEALKLYKVVNTDAYVAGIQS